MAASGAEHLSERAYCDRVRSSDRAYCGGGTPCANFMLDPTKFCVLPTCSRGPTWQSRIRLGNPAKRGLSMDWITSNEQRLSFKVHTAVHVSSGSCSFRRGTG